MQRRRTPLQLTMAMLTSYRLAASSSKRFQSELAFQIVCAQKHFKQGSNARAVREWSSCCNESSEPELFFFRNVGSTAVAVLQAVVVMPELRSSAVV